MYGRMWWGGVGLGRAGKGREVHMIRAQGRVG